MYDFYFLSKAYNEKGPGVTSQEDWENKSFSL